MMLLLWMFLIYLGVCAAAWYSIRAMLIAESKRYTNDDLSYIAFVFIPVINFITIFVALYETAKTKDTNLLYKFFNVKK